MKSPEDLKELLMKRAEERQQMAAIEAEPPEEVEPEITDEEIAEAEDMIDSLDEESELDRILFKVEEQGFEGYVNGAQQEDNPYVGEEALAEAWNEGWFGAHTQTCTANILVAAKQLVGASSPEDAEKALKRLEGAIEEAADIIDFEEADAFVQLVIEGAPAE